MDHQALVTFMGTKGVGRRPFSIARWHARLLAYNYQIEFKKSSENATADALSKVPQQGQVQETEHEVAEETVCLISPCVTHQEFIAETMQDPVLQMIVGCTTSAWPSSKSLPFEAVPFHLI